jgi:asparagine synthase (glutamine-hydrolysing)
MCGIAGAIGPRGLTQTRIERTLPLMQKRGPDGTSVKTISLGDQTVTLLFSRLAIIDPSPRSMQPFIRDNLVIITNGELYNHLELKKELTLRGHLFTTESDTEVMLAAWQEWGESSLNKMEGMWAFALIDKTKNRLILCRDRFGEKPLYTWLHKGTLYFGSEPKFLASLAGSKPQVNEQQIKRFLTNGYKSLYKKPATYFEDIHELPAAHFMRLSCSRPTTPFCYWSLNYTPSKITESDAIDGVREHLENSIRLRMRSDQPIAFCLSGGIDSSVITGMSSKLLNCDIKTFSIIDDDERYNERKNIKSQVNFLGCSNHRIQTSKSGFFDRLKNLISYHDMPIATLTYYLHSFMSEAIANSGCKVAISGNGADELFTGYYDHYSFWLAEMQHKQNFQSLKSDWYKSYGAHVQNPLLSNPLVFCKTPHERGHIYLNSKIFNAWLNEPFEEEFEESMYSENMLRNRMLNEINHETIPVILHEDDLNSMHYSVENRSPYLDRNLAEFLFSIPPEHLIKNGFVKYLLRAAGNTFVADDVLWDKRKRGFNAPIDSLVDRTDNDTRDQLMAEGPIFDIVKRDAIESFLNEDLTDNSFSKNLFSFISAKLFLEHHRDWRP